MLPPLLLSILLFSVKLYADVTPLKIYAAASLTNVLQEVAKEYTDSKVIFNFGATSKLAQQIAAGAPADLFFSADKDWMDHLQSQQRILVQTRFNLLSNKLVLIVPRDTKMIPKSSKELQTRHYIRIALAGESVPAGRYARIALAAETTNDLQKKFVNADNVRVVLTWVAKHEAEAGVVYVTDALLESKVRVAFAFDEETYPRITYPVAVLKSTTSEDGAQRFIEFCKSEKGQRIFAAAGFLGP